MEGMNLVNIIILASKISNFSYDWRINIPVLVSCFNNIARFPLVNDVQYTEPVLFIGGENSDFIE